MQEVPQIWECTTFQLIRSTCFSTCLQSISNREISWLQPLSEETQNTADDYKVAQWVLIKQAHSDEITEEEVINWDLFCDQTKNLWQAKGRLKNAELDEDTKYQIYLSKDHLITKLLIQQKHEELYHTGVALSKLRHRFWIRRETRLRKLKPIHELQKMEC